MLAAYRPLFDVPGARRFIAGAALSRIGGAMFGVAIIVMVSTRRDSYALAGAVSAVGVVVLAVASPVIGGLIDRWGQRQAAMPFIVLSALLGLSLATSSVVEAPAWTLFVLYGLASFIPELGPMSRARWVHIFEGDDEMLHTAMSFEQVLEEFSFVLGPVLAVAVSTTLLPEAGLILAVTVFTLGALIFLTARATEPPVVPHAERPPGLAIHNPGVVVIAVAGLMIGVIFGAHEVLAVAVSDAAGHKSFSAVILGTFAFASGVASLWFGTRTFRWSLTRRLLLFSVGMFVLQSPALVVTNLWGLAVVLFGTGLTSAPVIITALTLVQRLVPRAQLTEGMAVVITGPLVGISLGTALSGWAVDRLGAHPAYVVPVLAGLFAAVIIAAHRGRLERAEAASGS